MHLHFYSFNANDFSCLYDAAEILNSEPDNRKADVLNFYPDASMLGNQRRATGDSDPQHEKNPESLGVCCLQLGKKNKYIYIKK